MGKGNGTTRTSAAGNPRGLSNSNIAGYNPTPEIANQIQERLNRNLSRFGTSQGTYRDTGWEVTADQFGYTAYIQDKGYALAEKLRQVADEMGLDAHYDDRESDSFSMVFLLRKRV